MASIPASQTILEYLLETVLLLTFPRTKRVNKIFVQKLSNTPQFVNTTSSIFLLIAMRKVSSSI